MLKYLGGFAPPVVHRDVTPANVIYDRDAGLVSLVDFGFAGAELSQGSRIVSTVVGTFGYMAPEQFRGVVDPRSDLYAAGATALFLCTGRPPSEFAKGLRTEVSAAVVQNERLRDLISALLARPAGPSAPLCLCARFPLAGARSAAPDLSSRGPGGRRSPSPRTGRRRRRRRWTSSTDGPRPAPGGPRRRCARRCALCPGALRIS